MKDKKKNFEIVLKDGKSLPVEYDKSTGLCIYCNKDETDGVDCGKLLTDEGRQLYVHKYCLLFASGLPQTGADDEGIEGFLVWDIVREFRRARRLHCYYCHKNTATIGCSRSACKRSFHFNCGVENEAMFCFFDAFLVYCSCHRPQQDIKVSPLDPATVTCPICFEDVEARVSNHTLKTPCCTNTWFHRSCVQRQALSAGYFFRCAICNNQEQFQVEMKQFGIYIPEHDASWEMEENAYQELYWRHDKCDIDPCLCPKGRQFNKGSSKWELVLCDLCGSSGCHLACGGLKSVSQDWACSICNAMMSNATEVSRSSSASPHKSPDGDSPSKTGQTTRTAMKLMGKHPRTPLSSQTFRKKTAASPLSSLKLHNGPEESGSRTPDPVGSFEHCQPSTSRHGLEDADPKKGRKRKLSHSSKENDLRCYAKSPDSPTRYSRKIHLADQLSNDEGAPSPSGLVYGSRTTLRMSMRPRKMASLGNGFTTPTLKQSPKITEKLPRAETDPSPSAAAENVPSAEVSSQTVFSIGKSNSGTVSSSPGMQELPSFTSGAFVGGVSVRTKSVASFSQGSESVGLRARNPKGTWKKKARNATVTRPVEEEPLSCLAAKLASSVSGISELGLDNPEGNSSGSQQLTRTPPSSVSDSHSSVLVGKTSKSDTVKVSAVANGITNKRLASCRQTCPSDRLGGAGTVAASSKEASGYTPGKITGWADTGGDSLKLERSPIESPRNAAPPPNSTSNCIGGTSDVTKDPHPNKYGKVKNSKKKGKGNKIPNHSFGYAVFGGKRRRHNYPKKKQPSASLNLEINAAVPGVCAGNRTAGKEKSGSTGLLSADTEVQTPGSPLYPQSDFSCGSSPGNISGCSSTLFALLDNTESVCASPSGPGAVINPGVGPELQGDIPSSSERTTPSPSPYLSSNRESSPQQGSPWRQTEHCSPPGCHPGFDLTDPAPWGLSPDYDESSSQQTADPLRDKPYVARAHSSSTPLRGGGVTVEAVDPSPHNSGDVDNIEQRKTELLPDSLLRDEETATSVTTESLQRSSTPVMSFKTVRLEDGPNHPDSTQESDKTLKAPPDVHWLLNGNTHCPEVDVDRQFVEPLNRKEADRPTKPKKKRKSSTLYYPVIGTRTHFTVLKNAKPRKRKSKRGKRTCETNSVPVQQRHSSGTCPPEPSQNGGEKAQSLAVPRLSSGRFMKRQKAESPGGEPARSSMTVPESPRSNLTNANGAVELSSSESNTVTMPAENFYRVRHQSVVGRSKDSSLDGGLFVLDRVWRPESHRARQSTGKLLRRNLIRDRVETAQDAALDEGERETGRTEPGPPASENQETEPRPDVSTERSSDANVTQDKKMSAPLGDETDGDTSAREPAIRSKTTSCETSPDSGISQGSGSDRERWPPGQPGLTPTKTHESAPVSSIEGKSVDLAEASDQQLSPVPSRGSSLSALEPDKSSLVGHRSKNNPTENDTIDDDVILLDCMYFKPVQPESGPNSSRSQSPVTSVCRSSDMLKEPANSPKAFVDSKSSTRDSPQSGDDLVPNPHMKCNLWRQRSNLTPTPSTPSIKPTQMEPSLTFGGMDGPSSVVDSFAKPTSCPGKCQSERDLEMSEKSRRSLRKRDTQKLCSKVRANLFKVKAGRGRPLKRPKMDIPARPVSPLVSGPDASVTSRSKTRIYLSKSLRAASCMETNEGVSPRSQPGSGPGRLVWCHADSRSSKLSDSLPSLTSTEESSQWPWVLRSQTKFFPSQQRPVTGEAAGSDAPNSFQVRPFKRPTEGESPKTPTGPMNSEGDGGPRAGHAASSPLTRTSEPHPQGIASGRMLRCSREGTTSSAESVSPFCSPLPSSPCSPKQPRIYRSLLPQSTSNKLRHPLRF